MPKLQITQGRNDGAIEIKIKLYLQIILLINYMAEENLFVYVECSCKACNFTVFWQKKCHQKKKKKKMKRKKVTPGWTDVSGPGPVSNLPRSSMHYIILTPHNPIKPLNIVSANSFS